MHVAEMISDMYHVICKTEIWIIEHIECSCIFSLFMMIEGQKLVMIGQNMLPDEYNLLKICKIKSCVNGINSFFFSSV